MEIEIVNYIKEARAHGLGDQEIKQNLLDVGWDPGQVEDSFGYAKVSANSVPVQPIVAQPTQSPAQTAPPKLTPAEKALSEPDHKPQAFPPHLQQTKKVDLGQPLAQSESPLFSKNSQLASKFSVQSPVAKSEQQAPSLSDQHFERPKSGKKTGLIILVVLILLGALGYGGYFAYANYYLSPIRIWSGVTSSKPSTIVKSNFSLSYTDPGSPDSAKDESLKLTLSGNAYTDATNASSTILNADLNAGYKAGDQSGSVGFKTVFLNNILYLNLASIPNISEIAGQPIAWVKIDVKSLEALASSTPMLGTKISDQLDEQKQSQEKIKNDIQKLVKDKQIVTAVKYLGSENINGIPTYHLQNQIDLTVLRQVIGTAIDDSPGFDPLGTGDQAKTEAKKMFGEIADKVQVANFETWVGKKDHHIYKINLDLKFPALSVLGESSFSGTQPTAGAARDLMRVDDMKMMQSALELYYNKHNGYPAGQNGLPIGVTPNFVTKIPIAPMPSDGDCTDYFNTYWYVPTGTPTTNNGLLVYPSYQYTFCLGANSKDNVAGIGKMTQDGIKYNIPCTDKPENCHKQADTEAPAKVTKPVPQADLQFQITYSDYDKKETVTAPADALDLAKWLGDKIKDFGSDLGPME